MLFYAKLFQAVRTQHLQVCLANRDTVYPAIQPSIVLLACLGLLVIFGKEDIVAVVVSLDWRRMRNEWAFDYGVDQKSGNYGAVGSASNKRRIRYFFSHKDDSLGRAHAFDHYAEVSPTMSVALGICPLHMNDCHIRIDCTHGPQAFLGFEWGEYLIEEVISLCGVTSQRGFRGQERNAHSASLQPECDGEIGHVEDFQPILLDGTTKVVGRTHHDITDPGGDDL